MGERGHVLRLPCGDNLRNLVGVCIFVLDHIADPQRNLRQGGQLQLATFQVLNEFIDENFFRFHVGS